MNNEEQLSLKEKELLLKEKEIELRERELRLKEMEFRQAEEKKQRVEEVFNTVKEKITPSLKQKSERRGLLSLREADNANIFSSEGVLGRKGLWFFTLIYGTLYYVIIAVLGKIVEDSVSVNPSFALFYEAIIILGAVPTIFASIKRCRDCELNSWWLLLFTFIPLTGLYLLFAKPQANLDNYTTNWKTYSQSDEYLETKQRGWYVLWTILVLCVLVFVFSSLQGYTDAMNG